uniref:AlNc14C233G9324 protein n=1 Tax=Albugo laibachii Nc14 TaxID=890382 RepID=F0WSI1_9STRA|nr:AlNc14C233G9324 [Albugo laibachii Nc14]|eukprot:CCA24304.1 AlNc14C233G9324 [Albugo laibachii Nc14]
MRRDHLALVALSLPRANGQHFQLHLTPQLSLYMKFKLDIHEVPQDHIASTSRTLTIAPQGHSNAGPRSRMDMVTATYNLYSSTQDCEEEDLDIEIPQAEIVTAYMRPTTTIPGKKTTGSQGATAGIKKRRKRKQQANSPERPGEIEDYERPEGMDEAKEGADYNPQIPPLRKRGRPRYTADEPKPEGTPPSKPQRRRGNTQKANAGPQHPILNSLIDNSTPSQSASILKQPFASLPQNSATSSRAPIGLKLTSLDVRHFGQSSQSPFQPINEPNTLTNTNQPISPIPLANDIPLIYDLPHVQTPPLPYQTPDALIHSIHPKSQINSGSGRFNSPSNNPNSGSIRPEGGPHALAPTHSDARVPVTSPLDEYEESNHEHMDEFIPISDRNSLLVGQQAAQSSLGQNSVNEERPWVLPINDRIDQLRPQHSHAANSYHSRITRQGKMVPDNSLSYDPDAFFSASNTVHDTNPVINSFTSVHPNVGSRHHRPNRPPPTRVSSTSDLFSTDQSSLGKSPQGIPLNSGGQASGTGSSHRVESSGYGQSTQPNAPLLYDFSRYGVASVNDWAGPKQGAGTIHGYQNPTNYLAQPTHPNQQASTVAGNSNHPHVGQAEDGLLNDIASMPPTDHVPSLSSVLGQQTHPSNNIPEANTYQSDVYSGNHGAGMQHSFQVGSNLGPSDMYGLSHAPMNHQPYQPQTPANALDIQSLSHLLDVFQKETGIFQNRFGAAPNYGPMQGGATQNVNFGAMGYPNLGYGAQAHVPPPPLDDQLNMQPLPPNFRSNPAQPYTPRQFYRSSSDLRHPPRRLQSGDASQTHRNLTDFRRNHRGQGPSGHSNPRCIKHPMLVKFHRQAMDHLIQHKQLLEDPKRPGNFAVTLSFIRQYPKAIFFLWGNNRLPTINPLSEPPELEMNQKVFTLHPIYLSNLDDMGSLVAMVEAANINIFKFKKRPKIADPESQVYHLNGVEYELEGLSEASVPLSFDFGSGVTFIPRAAYDYFMNFLVGDASYPNAHGPVYLPRCSINPTPPVFRIEIAFKYVLELSAEEYVFRDAKGGCTIGIQPNDAGVWKLGALVAKRYAIIVDNGKFDTHFADRISYLAFMLEDGKMETHIPEAVPKVTGEKASTSQAHHSNEDQMQEDPANVYAATGFDDVFGQSPVLQAHHQHQMLEPGSSSQRSNDPLAQMFTPTPRNQRRATRPRSDAL